MGRSHKSLQLITHLFAFGLLSINWSNDFSGGDIAAARMSFLSAHPIDIWGGFSGIFYSSIPEFLIGWGRYLLILQVALTLQSINLIYLQISRKIKRYQNVLFLILSLVSLYFATYLTRDSTSFSFILFGIAMLSSKTKKLQKTFAFIGYLSLIVGFSFRPWLSIVGVIILSLTLTKPKSIKIRAGLLILFIVSPLIFDQSAYLVNQKLKKVHPELQVVIMDASSFACLGIDDLTRKNGENVLREIDQDSTSTDRDLCKNFRMNTWQSAGIWSLSQAEKDSLGIVTPSTKDYKTRASTSLSNARIEAIRNAWLKMLLQNPKEYIELKTIQAAQLMLGADSADLNLKNAKDATSILRNLIYFPFNLLLAIHGMSIFACLLFLVLIGLKSTRLGTRADFLRFIGIISIPISWLGISAIAFIGDNGRYTYSATLSAFFLLSLWSVRDERVT